MTDDATHKEIVEIKSELKEVRQTQDSEVHLQRTKWEEHLDKVVSNNERLARLLLLLDQPKSAKQIITESGIPQPTCWRMLNKLEVEGIVMKLDKTENGSPIYKTARWYKILRLDTYLEKKFPKKIIEEQSMQVEIEPQSNSSDFNESDANKNQDS